MQLNKFLASCGAASRRKANQAICEGRVMVNGCRVETLGRVVDPRSDEVSLDGQFLTLPAVHRYVLLNKPSSVLTTSVDDRGRRTVLDLVPMDVRLFPVGRLDYDTEGVLLLTNDGDLAYRLTHPKFGVEKVYEAWVEGRVQERTLLTLSKGVSIDSDVVVRGEVKILERENDGTLLEIRVHEGKKRQIKRMMKAAGHPVSRLTRTCFAGLTVRDLDRGRWRYLTEKEVERLYRLTGLERMAV
jgi:pseudouridine synthase